MRKQHSMRITMLLSVTTVLLTLLNPQQIYAIPAPTPRVITGDNTFVWDRDTATLTLANYCYRTEEPIALTLPDEEEVTIHLIGNNYIEAGAAETISIGISGTGNVRITGEGTLLVKSGEANTQGSETIGIQVNRLTMEGGTLVVLTGRGTENGIALQAQEGVVLEGGTLYAHASTEWGTALDIDHGDHAQISGNSETVILTTEVVVSSTSDQESERQESGSYEWNPQEKELVLNHYVGTYLDNPIQELPEGAVIRCLGENILTTMTGQSLLKGENLTITGNGTLLLVQHENEAAYEDQERAAIYNRGTLKVSNKGLFCVSASSSRHTAGIMTGNMQITENLEGALFLGGDLKAAVGEEQKRTAGVETGGLKLNCQKLTSLGGNLIQTGGGQAAGIYVTEGTQEEVLLAGTIFVAGETGGYLQSEQRNQKLVLRVEEGQVQQFLAGPEEEALLIPERVQNLCPSEQYLFIEETQNGGYQKTEYRRGIYQERERTLSPEVPETITKPSPGRFIVVLDVTGCQNYQIQLEQSQKWLEQEFQTEQDREKMEKGQDVELLVRLKATRVGNRLRIRLTVAKDGVIYQELPQKLSFRILVQGSRRHNPVRTHRRYFISGIRADGSTQSYRDLDSHIHSIKIRTSRTGTYELTYDQVSIGDIYIIGRYRYRVTAIKPFTAENIGFATGEDTRNVWIRGKLVLKDRPFTITAVGRKAFYRNQKVQTINMAATVETLKYKCFSMCSRLTSATIGTGVTRIHRHILCINHNLRTVWIRTRKIRYVELPHEFLEARNCTIYVPRQRKAAYTNWLIRRGLRLSRCKIKIF